MEQIQIRVAILSDVPVIVELWKELMAFHRPLNPFFELRPEAAENFQSFLTANLQTPDKAHVLVATANKQLRGYMMGVINNTPPVFKVEQVGEIMDAFVLPKYRQQNLGQRLFGALKTWFHRQKVDQIDVNIAAGNPISSQFWAKMGFKPLLHHLSQEI